jgi:hypothetical protein
MASGTIRDGLALEYLFCPLTGQDVPDTSGNGYHGVLGLTDAVEPRMASYEGSDPDWVYNGIELRADRLWGTGQTDVVTAPAGEIIQHNTDTEITIEAWVYNEPGLLRGTVFAAGNEVVWIYAADTAIDFYTYSIYDVFERTDLEQVTGSTAVAEGVWYHMVGVRGATHSKVYLNGVEDGSSALTYPGTKYALKTFGSATDAARIGDRYIGAGTDNLNGLHNGHNGRIGELRIYRRALTADEVLFNFNASNYYPDGKNSCGVGPACRYYAM